MVTYIESRGESRCTNEASTDAAELSKLLCDLVTFKRQTSMDRQNSEVRMSLKYDPTLSANLLGI